MSNPSTADTSDLPITPAVLQRWQEELQWFFTATRDRLTELQSARQDGNPAILGGAALPAPQYGEQASPAPASAASHTSAPPQLVASDATPQALASHPSATHEEGQTSISPTADGSSDRLQELKRRLAAQLANQ